MSNRIGTLAILALLSSAAACSAPFSTPAPAQAGQVVRGSVALSSYAIDDPVVVARTADGRAFFAPILADGSFAITLPSGASARLAIANTTRAGGYVVISRILWPGTNAAWARLDGTTATIALGNVRPAAGSGVAIQDHGGSSSDGSGDTSGGSSSSSSGGGGSDGSGHCSEGSGEVHACGTTPSARAELPYDVRPPLGSTFKLEDAFLAKGTAPAAIVAVTMDGGSWRLAELQGDTSFVITQADCDHQGNRSVGRDRVFVTWKNPDGTTATDHLDLRYCDGSSTTTQSDGSGSSDDSGMSPDDCESDGTPVCAAPAAHDSECDGKSDGTSEDDDHGDDATCPAGSPSDGGSTTPPAPPSASGGTGTTGTTGGGNGVTTGTAGGGANGDACTVNADCGIGLECIASRCQPVLH